MDSDFSFEYLLQSPQENTTGEEEEERTIQRETSYKRKLEELLWRPFLDYGDETMAAQMQSPSRNPSRPNPRCSGQEQLAAPSHLECGRTPPTRTNSGSGPSDPMVSRRKQVESPSKSPPQQLQPSNYFSLNDQPVHFYCEICQVPCSGSLNYNNHLNGKKHKVKFEELKFGWKDEGDDDCVTDNPKLWIRCEKCKIWCIDENALKQHLAGKKHKKMQKKLETVGGEMGEELECALCGIGCSSKELLQLHLKGKKHREELQKREARETGGGKEGRNREKNHFMNGLEVKKRQWRDLIRDNGANN
ncbi:hypothetical protein HRI_004247500 [Hibiscus trionum]|uniref:C2H2-type domain-containing protein n=1 Tax=Hibiscus trionum TaxID=183268 RepID=A0A9W7MIJ5_HIBTR|nr:hypothetical protein HRI_004247500 [Hibiscus trionum]